MKTHLILIPLLVFVVAFTGCAEKSTAPGSASLGLDTTFNLQCDLSVNYTPSMVPITSAGASSVASTGTTVIVVHGKSASPTRDSMQTLAADLNAQGYDVIMPYMPWSDLVWDGTLCDSMAYLNNIVTSETETGHSVVIMGHSMGGPVILSYVAMESTTKPRAIAVLAPGHIVPNSSVLAGLHAESIQRAKDMVSEGQGDTIATFQTSEYNISTTPTIYLSFHDTAQLPDQFPNLFSSISRVTVPVLWLAGKEDVLTSIFNNLGFIDAVQNNSLYTYKEISGDHFSMVDNVTYEFDSWYEGIK